MSTGKFITLEGGEGGGKSTQIDRLAEALESLGLDVVKTREPGGAPGAEAIRRLLVQGDTDQWDALTEVLLHYAARNEHLKRTVRPALEEGQWVISDRFADSTLAYQGYGHGLDREIILSVHERVVGSFKPDLTLILDIPIEKGLTRAHHRGAEQDEGALEDRYERMDWDFHQRVRDGFLEIAKNDPERCVVIDADRDADAVQDAVQAAVAEHLGRI